MRVEGGSARGIELRTPPGRTVRPVTSLAKQAIFSMIDSAGCDYHTVLDLFAGSGALGIEALSRGASRVDFVDHNRGCCTTIQQNLRRAGFVDYASVHCMPAAKAITMLQNQYDLVIMDPPYDDASTSEILSTLTTRHRVSEEGLIVVSHGARHPIAESYGQFGTWKKRRYGDTHICIFRRKEQ